MTAQVASVRLDDLLYLGRLNGASDIHLAPGAPAFFRIDGKLEPRSSEPATQAEMDLLVQSLTAGGANPHVSERPEITVMYRSTHCGAVRAHIYSTYDGPGVALRLLPAAPPSLDELHMPAIFRSLPNHAAGLVIFAGPTGSGKSTAMAALVDLINRTSARHVITIEDPVEYRHTCIRSIVTQREIDRNTPGYADAIAGALRSDPDVLLIGEMRSRETMHAALTAAETGHLVFSTLHTSDTSQTIDRIIGSFEGAVQEQIRVSLAQSLIAVVALRLVPRLKGTGRVPAVEVLLATPAVRNLIREGKTHQIRNVLTTARAAGMMTLEAHLSDLVDRGEIGADAARAATERPSELRLSALN